MSIGGRRPNLVTQRTGANHSEIERRPENAGVDAPALLEPPDDLAPGAKVIWHRLVPDLVATKVFRDSDGVLLAHLCETLDMADGFRREIHELQAKVGHQETEKGEDRISGMLKRARTGYRDMLKTATSIASEFGISPVARLRLGLMQVQGNSLLDVIKRRGPLPGDGND